MNQQIQTLIPMMIYGLILLVFVMGVALAFLAVSYRRIIEKLATYEDQERKSLMKANAQALEIVKKAQEQASSIIDGSGKLVKYNNSLLEKDLKAVSEKELVAYKEALEAIRKQVGEIIKDTSKDITTGAQKELSTSIKTYEDQFGKTFELMLAEVADYKAKRINEVDSKVIEIINQTALSVLNKSLSQEDHTNLILKALEEAKKKHVF